MIRVSPRVKPLLHWGSLPIGRFFVAANCLLHVESREIKVHGNDR